MKKITSLLLAASMAAALGICLTACDEKPSSDNGSPDAGSSQTTTYTVSSTEWASLLGSANNFSCGQSFTDSDTTHSFKYTADSYQLNGTEKQIITKSGETCYMYLWDSQTSAWKQETMNETDYQATMAGTKAQVTSFASLFSSFTYSEETHAYTCASATVTLMPSVEMAATNITIKFENAAIVSLTFTADGRRVNTFTDFGSTVIEIPNVN